MSEKVYGIYGTNKCRKEAIAKENITVLSGSVFLKAKTEDGQQTTNYKDINLPAGFTDENSVVISFEDTSVGINPDVATRAIFNYDKLTIVNRMDIDRTVYYRIVLMKI